jgi:plastocyanin
MSRRKIVSLVALALAGATVPVTAAAGAAGKTVTLKDIAFSAKSVSISEGSKVTFAFRDDGTTHNVTSTGSTRFKTIADRSSGSVTRTFSSAGTYRYACTLHPGMSGRIVVH